MKKKGRVIYMTLLPAPRDAVIPLSSYFFLSPNLSFLPFFPQELSLSLLASPSSIDKDRPCSPQSSLYHSFVSLGEEKEGTGTVRYGAVVATLVLVLVSSRSLFPVRHRFDKPTRHHSSARPLEISNLSIRIRIITTVGLKQW